MEAQVTYLLFLAMFILIVTLAVLFGLHLRDHENEQAEAEEFAQKFVDYIRERLSEEDEES